MAGTKIVRVRVDPEKCQGHSRCKALAPALFELFHFTPQNVTDTVRKVLAG